MKWVLPWVLSVVVLACSVESELGGNRSCADGGSRPIVRRAITARFAGFPSYP